MEKELDEACNGYREIRDTVFVYTEISPEPKI